MHQPMQGAGAQVEKKDCKPTRGWGFPGNSRKAHYFDDSMFSLCKRWAYTGELEDPRHEHQQNCVACAKKRAKLFDR